MVLGVVGQVLDQVWVYLSLVEVMVDIDYVYVMIVWGCELIKFVLIFVIVMQDVCVCIVVGVCIVIIFGFECVGLENDDVVWVNVIIIVLVNFDFLLLNFVQVVLLNGYEWLCEILLFEFVLYGCCFDGEVFVIWIEIEKLVDYWEEWLVDVGFFFFEEKVLVMKLMLCNLWL